MNLDCPRYPGTPCHCEKPSIFQNTTRATEVVFATAPIAIRIGNTGLPENAQIVSPGSLPTLYEGPC